jgi:hypothetical protein
MGIASRLKAEAAVLREHGPADLLLRLPRYTARRVVESYYERRFGIDTRRSDAEHPRRARPGRRALRAELLLGASSRR